MGEDFLEVEVEVEAKNPENSAKKVESVKKVKLRGITGSVLR